MISPPYLTPHNPQEFTRVTMRVYAGGTGSVRVETVDTVLIPYGPGSKSGCL
jgi:hypothetical protein